MADPPTHFFKFIPAGFLFNLSVPSAFLTNLNGKRCLKAILRHGRHKWSVDIDDGVFGDGWRKFVTENGVQEFDFIVFKHQGNMVFDFMVFDQSTCQKHYTNLFDELDEEPLTESDTICIHRRKKLKKRKRNDYASQDKEIFQVDDSGCFESKITPYVIKKSRLHVPINFARSNGLITRWIHTPVYLMDDTQRTWPATLTKTKTELCITGWREFIVKNHLKVGDVCRFELIKNGELPVFKCYNTGKNLVENDIQEKGTSSSTFTNHPYFISTLKPTTLKRWILYLPADFSKPNGLKIGEMILRDDKGRSWKVHLNKMNRTSFYLGGGLRSFLVANGMKEGDEFKFELLEKEKDKSPIANFLFLKSKQQIKSHKEEKLSRKEGYILCEEDGHPYFMGEVKFCSIRKSVLFLPIKFAKSNGLMNPRKMTLKNVEDERSWTVELENYKNRYYYIGQGWKDFRVANGLKKGDRFKFELVNNGENPIVNFYFEKSC
ncbi:B3 domain-containing protein REM17 [Lactuca sativa]|uniref:TF-B3 domain-containing protein n=1 Tax=Lactuca sativa TaxID=4236 RepID=A0A9R1WQA5_LACSA|nr:B3 domain-containing protein REM17 [Lactuca sativa]KAJ0226178.1 hypothetical protein LSAT_V11C100017930 [Lactuca sativa]